MIFNVALLFMMLPSAWAQYEYFDVTSGPDDRAAACEAIRSRKCDAKSNLGDFSSVIQIQIAKCKASYETNKCQELEKDPANHESLTKCDEDGICQTYSDGFSQCIRHKIQLGEDAAQAIFKFARELPDRAKLTPQILRQLSRQMSEAIWNSYSAQAQCNANANGEKNQMIEAYNKQLDSNLQSRWSIEGKIAENYLDLSCTQLAQRLATRLKDHDREYMAQVQAGTLKIGREIPQAELDLWMLLKDLATAIQLKANCYNPVAKGELLCNGTLVIASVAAGLGLTALTARSIQSLVARKILTASQGELLSLVVGAPVGSAERSLGRSATSGIGQAAEIARVRSPFPSINAGGTRLELPAYGVQVPIGGLKRVKEVVQNLNTTAFKRMQKPEALEVWIDTDLNNKAGAGMSSQSWVLATKQFGYYLRKEDLEAIDAHEYTHGIFAENMGRHSKEWQEWQDRRKTAFRQRTVSIATLQAREKALDDQLKQMTKLPNHRPDKSEAIRKKEDELVKEAVKVRQQIEEAKGQASDIPGIVNASSSHQEIMSDLGGMFQRGGFKEYADSLERNLRANLQSMENFDDRLAMERSRAFTVKVPVEGWNERLAKAPVGALDQLRLNPARSFLYENYLSKPEVMKRMDEFMPKLFDCLARDVVEHQADMLKTDAETINRRLIQRLKSDLKEFE